MRVMSKEYLENIEIINAYVKELSLLECKSSLNEEEALMKAGLIKIYLIYYLDSSFM